MDFGIKRDGGWSMKFQVDLDRGFLGLCLSTLVTPALVRILEEPHDSYRVLFLGGRGWNYQTIQALRGISFVRDLKPKPT